MAEYFKPFLLHFHTYKDFLRWVSWAWLAPMIPKDLFCILAAQLLHRALVSQSRDSQTLFISHQWYKTPILPIIWIHLRSTLQNDLSRAENIGYHVLWKKNRLNNDNKSFVEKKEKYSRRPGHFFFGRLSCAERDELVLRDKTNNWKHLRRWFVI